MESCRAYCELLRLDDVVLLYGLKHSLEARGIAAEVWRGEWGGWRSARGGPSRLMVPRSDVVYARWVAAANGLKGRREEDGAGAGTSAGTAHHARSCGKRLNSPSLGSRPSSYETPERCSTAHGRL